MAATYEPIATITTTSSTSGNVHTFSGIPGTYTDLVLIVAADVSSSPGYGTTIRFNSDSGTNYGQAYFYGNGTSTFANQRSGQNGMYLSYGTGVGTSAPNVSIVHIQNYASTNIKKSAIIKTAVTDPTYPGVEVTIGIWDSTAAITSITYNSPVSVIASGSTLTLYGIKAA
jgi:hypothetical protein